jgi:hypothetical protein
METATSNASSLQLSPSTACLLKIDLQTDFVGSPNVVRVAVIFRETSTTPSQAPDALKSCPTGFKLPENNGCLHTDGSRTLKRVCGAYFYRGDLTTRTQLSLRLAHNLVRTMHSEWPLLPQEYEKKQSRERRL